MKAIHVKGKPILLAKVDGEVFGVSNRCLNMGCTLERGILSGYIVRCPCHGWKFDVRNGQYQENPQTTLACYAAKSRMEEFVQKLKNPNELPLRFCL